MNKEEYELFKKQWLDKFKGYYQNGKVDKRKIKKSIYDNPLLLESQKEDFWNIVRGDKND